MVSQQKITDRFLHGQTMDTGRQLGNMISNIIEEDCYCRRCNKRLNIEDMGIPNGFCRECFMH